MSRVMQRGGMRRILGLVVLVIRVRPELFRLGLDAISAGAAVLRAQVAIAGAAEERIHIARDGQDVAREIRGFLETREGRVDLSDGDGVFVIEIPLRQPRVETGRIRVVRLALAVRGTEGEISRCEVAEFGRVFELCRR